MQVTNQKEKNLIIRDARPEELDEVGRIIKRAYRQYEEFVPKEAWDSYVEDAADVRSRLKEAALIVAELDGKLAGTVTLYLEASRSYVEGWPKNWAGIRLLAVDPAFRGRGIGRALMEECLRRCREHGVRTIGLHTSMMMDVARRMYERMGFKRAPEYDFYPAPDATVMAYLLDIGRV